MLKKFLIGTLVGVALLAGASVAQAYDFGTTTLKVGSKGAAVMAVQTVVGATADGSFGPMTKAKVMAWQASNGLTADGLFGNMSKAKANSGSVVVVGGALCPNGMTLASNCTLAANAQAVALCPNGMTLASNCGVAPTAGEVTTGPLVGTFGTISTITKISSYNNEEIGDGQNDVKVIGFEVKTSNDGDVSLNSLKLTFDGTGNAGSSRIADYLSSVKVWMGSTEVGSANTSDFTKDSTGIYSKTIPLNGAVVRADKTVKFYVSVDAVNNLDSGDITGDSWTVGINNIRYVDGSGVVTTETALLAAAAGALGWNSANDGVGISFVAFATAANTAFKILTDSSSPTAGIIISSDTADTNDVVLLKGKIKVEGTSDLTLNSFPITLTAAGATNIDALTGNLTLVIGSDEFSESTSANCSPTCVTNTTATVTFDNLDLTIDAGSTVNFTVKADINNIDAVSLDEGDSLLASLTSTNLNQTDVEDSQGDQVADADKTGSLAGKAQEFRTQGISVTLVSTSAVSSNDTGNNNDTGTFKITFKVTAIGENAYVATYLPATYYPYTIDRSGTATTTGISAVITNNTDTTLSSAYNWEINAGESETLTLTASLQSLYAAGLYKLALNSVLWASTDDNTPGNTYSSNMDSFKTDYVSMN